MDNRFKFRVFISNKMYEVFYFYKAENGVIFACTNLKENTGFNIDGSTFMQCTGLKDKNSKLIYNGDIVKRQNRHIGVVIFESGCFKIKWQDGVYYQNARHIDDYQASSLEIIGNIYENSELLEINK